MPGFVTDQPSGFVRLHRERPLQDLPPHSSLRPLAAATLLAVALASLYGGSSGRTSVALPALHSSSERAIRSHHRGGSLRVRVRYVRAYALSLLVLICVRRASKWCVLCVVHGWSQGTTLLLHSGRRDIQCITTRGGYTRRTTLTCDALGVIVRPRCLFIQNRSMIAR
ncbi:hypothetical protein MRX96_022976 [Rhipicephalus microplus]